MSHALTVQADPHLKFAHLVDTVLTSGEPLGTQAIKIKSAAALYVGECQAREMRAYEAARTSEAQTGAMPRYVERDNPLLPPPLAVVPPSEPTTEFEPTAPDSEPAPEPGDNSQPQPAAGTTPIAKPKTARKPARSTTRPLPKPPAQP